MVLHNPLLKFYLCDHKSIYDFYYSVSKAILSAKIGYISITKFMKGPQAPVKFFCHEAKVLLHNQGNWL